MNMRRWVLPEAIEDLLPRQARQLEDLRRRLLDCFAGQGYQLVQPPLLEYLDSLLTGTGSDLNLRTFKLVDQVSGRTMGIRADTTPQVARIDAHLLNRAGVTRLCYCGSVLHTLPADLLATRQPVQIGAELYGHAGLEADIEIIRLLAQSLALSGIAATRLDLGHVAVFRALMAHAGLNEAQAADVFATLQAKDLPGLRAAVENVAEPVKSALLALPECYGGVDALDRLARVMPDDAAISAALADLRRLAEELQGLPISFDLSDLRGYHYHSGVVFAAYCGDYPAAIALGGRYDEVGQSFGRGRPATGFSMDLRVITRLAPEPEEAKAILAPLTNDPALIQLIKILRQQGDIVVSALPGHEGTWREAGCDRQLVFEDSQWLVRPLGE